MKKIYLLLLLSTGFAVFGQAFHKNDIVLNAGIGLGLYGTRSEYVNTTNGEHINESGGAASLLVPITAEYALHHKWGIGLQLAPAFYANDSSYKKTRSFALGLFGAYHFFVRDRIELYTRLAFGFASLTHREVRTNGEYSWQLGGGYVRPSLGMRAYFSTRVGVFADLGIAGYSFEAAQYESPTGTVRLQEGELRLVATGVELSTGLTFKF